MLATVIAGCADRGAGDELEFAFESFRDIPGVTETEIEVVEALLSNREYFTYVAIPGTEAFIDLFGEVRGFTALVCDWLTDLFGIPFVPRIAEWDDLVVGLRDGRADFTGELTATEARRRQAYYFMTDDIAQRLLIKIHIADAEELEEIHETRPLRFAFLDGATTADIVAQHEEFRFERVYVSDFQTVREMLASGEIDAFLGESSSEAAFVFDEDIIVSMYFPIIYSPVSLTTRDEALKPIIDIVQKALESGAINHLSRLYSQGHQEYLRHKLFMQLTSE